MAVILRDYVARGRILPGVRSGEPHAWPFQVQFRPSTTPVASNGGDYVASRRALLTRYAAPWMLALHDLDIAAYGQMLYGLLCEHAEEGAFHDAYFMGDEDTKMVSYRPLHCISNNIHRHQPRGRNTLEDSILKLMVKLSQASIAFSAFDDLFEYWLSKMQEYGNYDEVRSFYCHQNRNISNFLHAACNISAKTIYARGRNSTAKHRNGLASEHGGYSRVHQYQPAAEAYAYRAFFGRGLSPWLGVAITIYLLGCRYTIINVSRARFRSREVSGKPDGLYYTRQGLSLFVLAPIYRTPRFAGHDSYPSGAFDTTDPQ